LSFTGDQMLLPGFSSDYVLLSIMALTEDGVAVIKSFQLNFGSNNMPIRVLDPTGSPKAGVLVEAEATTFPGLQAFCTTDATGQCSIVNLPIVTIGLVAKSDNNSIGVYGLATTTSLVTLQLMSFDDPLAGATFDDSVGTSGWTGGTQSLTKKMKRDTSLVVSSNGKSTPQSAKKSLAIHPFTKQVFIKYKFITIEVPKGYFGSKYNDYYSVTIRANTGTVVTVTNSMNALGLGAFDSTGATDWFTMSMSVPAGTTSVEYNIAVSNVGDSIYDSQVKVASIGEVECLQCGDCAACPTDPMCQNTCINPPPKSCDWYTSCAEAQLACGQTGYPLNYGTKNCGKFQNNLKSFTAAGQNFIWGTMSCLQKAMVPVLQPCTASCSSFSDAALNSQPSCYVQNGFCDLTCGDMLSVMQTVGKDLIDPNSLTQIAQTSVDCIPKVLTVLDSCAGSASAAAVNVVKQYLKSF
jgi:hypothetical protein